jgi:hypothetical protein
MRGKNKADTLLQYGLLMALLLFAAGCAANAQLPGQIELDTTEFDFGTVPNDRPISQIFQVHNVGRGTLEILGTSTSCGCTTAEIDNHRLAPGATTDLTVTYDPQAHDGATGEFMRIVYIRSDDPDRAETKLNLRVKVVEPDKEAS